MVTSPKDTKILPIFHLFLDAGIEGSNVSNVKESNVMGNHVIFKLFLKLFLQSWEHFCINLVMLYLL